MDVLFACSAYLSPLFSSQNITVIVAGEKATEAEGGRGYCPAAAAATAHLSSEAVLEM